MYIQQFKKLMKGVQIHWTCDDPLADVDPQSEPEYVDTEVVYPSKNRLFLKTNDDIIRRLALDTAHRWCVNIRAHCDTGTEQYVKEVEVVTQGQHKVRDLDGALCVHIEDMLEKMNKAHYQHFEFTATIE